MIQEGINQKINSNQSLLLQKINNILPDIQQSGKNVDDDTIAQLLDVPKQQVSGILSKVNISDKSTHDDLSLLVLDRYRAAQVFNHNQQAKPNKRVEYLKGGAAEVAKRTGLSVDTVVELAKTRWDEIQQRCQQLGIDVKPSFFASESKFNNSSVYDPSKETIPEAITRVVKELTDGFNSKYYGQISAYTIAHKLKDSIDHRTIDKFLSEDPSLRKLDVFRPRGKSVGVTDKDREVSYLRQIAQRAKDNDV